jgi:hypothetical protein
MDYEDLYGPLGLEPGFEAESRVIQLVQDLRQLKFVHVPTADLTVRADFYGLAWQLGQENRAEQALSSLMATFITVPGDQVPGRGSRDTTMKVDPIWKGRDFPIDEDLCFVLMPFKELFDTIYEDHIKPTVERLEGHSLRCRRADDIYRVGPFMDDVWEQTCRARFLIAELTGRNPNVFYELGIAHTVGKKVIMLTQTMEDVPADLRHHRVIPYSPSLRGPQKLEQDLARTIRSILEDGDT